MRHAYVYGLGFTLLAALAACAGQSVQQVTSEISAGIQAACTDANNALAIAGPGGAAYAPYVVGSCATATQVASLAQNSQTLQWLGQLIGQVKSTAPAAPTGA